MGYRVNDIHKHPSRLSPFSSSVCARGAGSVARPARRPVRANPAPVFAHPAPRPPAVDSRIGLRGRRLLSAGGDRLPDQRAPRRLTRCAHRRPRRGVERVLCLPAAPRRGVTAVSKGGYWVPRVLLTLFLDTLLSRGAAPEPTRRTSLSRREQDVLDPLLLNYSNKEIAARLNISERTVKFHVSNLLAKFQVQRRADLILQSFQAQALSPVGLVAGSHGGPKEPAV
ncbi:MAG: hypothetical protein DMF79_11330 [Acidobacteria bacterium]|nr:MAG: hypothetical protein DMF79_11330 [Acidobacteriota bacterium]